MKIEIGKKYKTRHGDNVTIQRIAFNKVYGTIEYAYRGGLFTIWGLDGTLVQSEMTMLFSDSGDLVEVKEVKEVKEDWKILVEHFENKGEQIFIVADGEICICTNMKQCERSQDYCKSLLVTKDDNYYCYYNIKKEKIKLATLEDCKKYILEK